jgi:hypothetical protein
MFLTLSHAAQQRVSKGRSARDDESRTLTSADMDPSHASRLRGEPLITESRGTFETSVSRCLGVSS